MPTALGSIAALACLYLMLRRILGTGAALLALGLAASGHFAVHWSRHGILNSHAPVLATVAAYCFWNAISTGRARWFVLAGFAFGACFYTHPVCMAIPLWGGLVSGIPWLLSRRFRQRYTASLLLTVLAALILYSPMLGLYTRKPGKFISRRGSMIFAKNDRAGKTLSKQHGENYLSKVFLLHLKRSVITFSSSLDACLQYQHRGGGLLDDVTLAAFVMGLAFGLWRWRHYAYGPLVLMVFLFWFLGSVMTTPSPHYGRMAGFAFLIYVVPAFWAREVQVAACESMGKWGGRTLGVLFAGGVLYVACVNFYWYFVKYDRQANNHQERQRSCIAFVVRDSGPSNITYVAEGSLPTRFAHRSHRFVAGTTGAATFTNAYNVRLPTDIDFDSITFIFPLKAASILKGLEERFPKGRLEEHRPPFWSEPVFYEYIVPYEGKDCSRMHLSQSKRNVPAARRGEVPFRSCGSIVSPTLSSSRGFAFIGLVP